MGKKSEIRLTKFKLSGGGVMNLFTSADMARVLREVGEAVARATGHPEDYEVVVHMLKGTNVAQVKIKEGNYKAYYNELETNDLLHALGSVELEENIEGTGRLTQAITELLSEML